MEITIRLATDDDKGKRRINKRGIDTQSKSNRSNRFPISLKKAIAATNALL